MPERGSDQSLPPRPCAARRAPPATRPLLVLENGEGGVDGGIVRVADLVRDLTVGQARTAATPTSERRTSCRSRRSSVPGGREVSAVAGGRVGMVQHEVKVLS